MKKEYQIKILLVFLIFLLNIQNNFGQTLTCQTSCPQAGEVFSMRTSSPVLNSPGLNQVWNFSSIYALASTYLISYSVPSSFPNATLYPQANLVKTEVGNNTFLSSGNGGIRSVYPSTINVNINNLQLPLPFTYGNTYTETVISTSVTGTDTFVTNTHYSFIGHGSGTLILPSGTFPDVLSIKYTSTESNTKNGSPIGNILSNTSFYYYSQKISHPLLYTQQLSTTGQGDYGPFTQFIDQVVVGLHDQNMEFIDEFTISPNPAKDIVKIKFPQIKMGKVLLKNNLGQLITERKFDDNSCQLDIGYLSEGIYFISLCDNNEIITRKLVVSR